MITSQEYTTLDKAYEYFNKHLFDGKLVECLITLHRHPKARGYYRHEVFSNRKDGQKISEIALNPDVFPERTDMEILSTLAHEMAHLYQYTLEDPPRRGYHDKRFSQIMFNVGLQTSSTGEPGGKTTGQRVSHYIIEGGRFEKVCGAFLLNHKLNWNSDLPEKLPREGKKKQTRTKYVCPSCYTNIWAKSKLNVKCADCDVLFLVEGE